MRMTPWRLRQLIAVPALMSWPLLTSKDADGAKGGYDLEMTKAVAEAVSLPVVASGGIRKLEHLYEAEVVGKATVLAASIFHLGEISMPQSTSLRGYQQ
jgi:cyclase